jgi:hypothetical protein
MTAMAAKDAGFVAAMDGMGGGSRTVLLAGC